MFYIITIVIVILGFLLAKYFYIQEGYINELDQVPSGIDEVPHDSLCLILHLMGAGLNKMGSLSNKCAFNKKDNLKKDTSNMCMI
jgi:hypothetical protein